MEKGQKSNIFTRRGAWWAAFVAVAAFAVRLGYLHGFQNSPFFSTFFLDTHWHHQWASDIAAGDWLGEGVFFRAPLYPYFLGIIYKLSGANLVAARIAQFLMGTASSVLVYLLGKRLFRREPPAVVAGLVFAFYGPMIYFEGELLIPVLIVFLDLGGLVLLYRALEKGSRKRFALAGFVFGLSAIARPNVLVPAALLAVWITMEGGAGYVRMNLSRRLAPFFIALMVAPLVVTVRNGLVGGDYVFIASQGGANFYMGNNPASDGKTAETLGNVAVIPRREYLDSVQYSSVVLAEKESGRKLKPSEVSRFWYKKALRWMAGNPAQAARLYFRKLFYLLHGHEIPSNNVPYFARRYSRVLSLLMWDKLIAFPAGIMIPLGLVGMALAWPERKPWAPVYIFVVFYAGTILVFFVTGRYRMPLVGPMVLFAIYGVWRASRFVSEKDWKKLVVVFAAFIALMFTSNVKAYSVKEDYLARPLIQLGNYYHRRGEIKKAVEYYDKALALYPHHYMALGNLALIAYRAGDYTKAERLIMRFLRTRPNDPYPHNFLGILLKRRGDFKGAEAEFKKALELNPDYAPALTNLDSLRGIMQGEHAEDQP